MVTARRSGRVRWLRAVAVCAVVVLGAQLLPPGAGLAGLGAGVALASPSPPPPVNPAPRVVPVTTPGPTQVTGNITTDTTWSPQGSPYVITNSISVAAGVELALLPGTVVKLQGSGTGISVFGELLSFGDPAGHVVFTSYRDDSVMGDTNGGGGATSPAPGDWYSIYAASGGVAVFDYTDVRYGGWGSACWAYGEINGSDGSQLVISSSSVTDSQNASVIVGTSDKANAGIYNSYFARSCMGVAATQPGELDVVGNTFSMPSGNTAIWLLYPQNSRVWFNTVNGLSKAYGQNPVTRAMADFRFNQLSGVAGGSSLNDWSDNWWGVNANSPLPSCMDPNVAASSVPQVSVSANSSGCPSGQQQVTGYAYPVLPALSSSPQVLPASVREAAAPRFGPVDTYSGALAYQAADLSVRDAGKAITEIRTYRSDRLPGGDAGAGWATSFDEAMSASGGISTLSLPDGSFVPFSVDPAAGYTPAPGVSASLTANADGSATVTSPGQVAYQFGASGQLTGMNLGDPGHHLTIDRSGGHVSKVTGVSGRYLSYAYVAAGTCRR